MTQQDYSTSKLNKVQHSGGLVLTWIWHLLERCSEKHFCENWCFPCFLNMLFPRQHFINKLWNCFLWKSNNHFLNKTLFLTIYWIENENGKKYFWVKLNYFHWYTITWFFFLEQVTLTWLHQVSASTIRSRPRWNNSGIDIASRSSSVV